MVKTAIAAKETASSATLADCFDLETASEMFQL